MVGRSGGTRCQAGSASDRRSAGAHQLARQASRRLTHGDLVAGEHPVHVRPQRPVRCGGGSPPGRSSRGSIPLASAQ